MNDIDGKDISLKVDAGNIRLKNSTFTRADFSEDAGNINLSDVSIENFSAQSDMGNITIEDSSFVNSDCKSDVGNIKFSPKESSDCYSYKLAADVGNIKMDANKSSGIGNKYQIDATDTSKGEHYFKAESNVGNITIENAQ